MSRKRCQVKRVHIEGETWTYQVGGSVVSIRDPQGVRTIVHRSKVTRGHEHNAGYGATDGVCHETWTYPTPAIVKNYIWRKLRPGQIIKIPGDYDQAKDAILHFFEGDVKQEPERIAGAQR
jgi:hypothetical protein